MSTRRASGDAVLDAALPLARQLLQWCGGFQPYAFALQHDGRIDCIFADCDEALEGAPLIELLRDEAGLLAGSEGLVGIAIVYDALVRDPRTEALQDAIAVEIAIGPRLETQRLVTVPYSGAPDDIRFGPASASAWSGPGARERSGHGSGKRGGTGARDGSG
mgnify:CR=1 FL=1